MQKPTCLYCGVELPDLRQRVCKARACRSEHRRSLYFASQGRPVPSQPSCKYCGVELANVKAKVCRSTRCLRAQSAEHMREAKRRAKRASWEQRYCLGCGEAIPFERRADATHCSKACIEKRRAVNGERDLWRLSYRERNRERQRQWRRENPAVVAGYKAKRRGLLAEASEGLGPVSSRDWEAVLRQYRYCCAYCGTSGKLTVDHVIPIARGGRHSIGNLLPACGRCNFSKQDKLLVEWRMTKKGRRHAVEALLSSGTAIPWLGGPGLDERGTRCA